MKILVTGALGHIGSSLVRNLPEIFNNPHIVMVDNLSTQRYCSLFNLPSNSQYRFIEGDIKNLSWSELLQDIDVVVHLAALTDAAGTADNPEYVHFNNFESTRLLADACLSMNIPVIFPSSTSVYGSQSVLVDETCQDLAPQSPYAECKLREETYLNDLFERGLKGVICRLGTIYGTSPGMRFHTAVNKFCWQAVMSQPLTVWETALNQKRPYLELDDCCAAISWIINNTLYDSATYNIVSNNFTVQNVVDAIRVHRSDLSLNLVQHKIMNQLSYEVSADKFKKTGFEFKGRLDQGIHNTISLLHKAHG